MAIWTPSTDGLQGAIAEQSPWVQFGRVPVSLASPTDRTIARALWQLLLTDHLRRHQLALGPRRVGKTSSHSLRRRTPPAVLRAQERAGGRRSRKMGLGSRKTVLRTGPRPRHHPSLVERGRPCPAGCRVSAVAP